LPSPAFCAQWVAAARGVEAGLDFAERGTAHHRRGAPWGPKSSFSSKAAFSSPNLRSDPRALECLGWVLRRAASSRYISGFEVGPVQCLHTATSRACLRVGRPARLDLPGCCRLEPSASQAGAQVVDASCDRALLRLSATRLDPVAGTERRQGAARRSWVRGLVSVHPLAAQAAARGAQREPACGGVR
jgi:hypothetical protein